MRYAYAYTPALAAGAVGLVLLITPWFAPTLPASIRGSATSGVLPTVSIIAGLWCVALSYAVWRRRPLVQHAVVGLIAIAAPVVVVQGAIQIDVALSVIQVARSSFSVDILPQSKTHAIDRSLAPIDCRPLLKETGR